MGIAEDFARDAGMDPQDIGLSLAQRFARDAAAAGLADLNAQQPAGNAPDLVLGNAFGGALGKAQDGGLGNALQAQDNRALLNKVNQESDPAYYARVPVSVPSNVNELDLPLDYPLQGPGSIQERVRGESLLNGMRNADIDTQAAKGQAALVRWASARANTTAKANSPFERAYGTGSTFGGSPGASFADLSAAAPAGLVNSSRSMPSSSFESIAGKQVQIPWQVFHQNDTMRAPTLMETVRNSNYGRAAMGAMGVLTAPARFSYQSALTGYDELGASFNALKNYMTGDKTEYEPVSAIGQSIQRQGVLATLGDGIRGVVLGLPGIGLVNGLYHRNPEDIGAGLLNIGLAGFGLYGEGVPVGSADGAASAGRLPPEWGTTPQATEHLYTQNRSAPMSMEEAVNHADQFDAFGGNLVDYEVTPSGSIKVDHGDGLSIHYRALEDADFDHAYGANKLAAYKSPRISEHIPFTWDDAFGGGGVNVHIRRSTLLSDRGTVAALSHEYRELLDLYNRVGERALTTGKWRSFIDGAHERTVPQVDSIINNMVDGGN